MSEKIKMGIVGAAIALVGGTLVWHFTNWQTLAGVFLLMWANNISSNN